MIIIDKVSVLCKYTIVYIFIMKKGNWRSGTLQYRTSVRPICISNSKFLKCLLLIKLLISCHIICNCEQSAFVLLPCSVHFFKRYWQLNVIFWTKEISLSPRLISNGFPILYQPQNSELSITLLHYFASSLATKKWAYKALTSQKLPIAHPWGQVMCVHCEYFGQN